MNRGLFGVCGMSDKAGVLRKTYRSGESIYYVLLQASPLINNGGNPAAPTTILSLPTLYFDGGPVMFDVCVFGGTSNDSVIETGIYENGALLFETTKAYSNSGGTQVYLTQRGAQRITPQEGHHTYTLGGWGTFGSTQQVYGAAAAWYGTWIRISRV